MRKQYYRKKKTVFSCAENHAGQKSRTKESGKQGRAGYQKFEVADEKPNGYFENGLSCAMFPLNYKREGLY
jgi:hypothetical protein